MSPKLSTQLKGGLIIGLFALFIICATPAFASAATTVHGTCANITTNAQASCSGDVVTFVNSSSLASLTMPYTVASGVTYYVSFTTTQTSCNSSCKIQGYFTGIANDTTNQILYQPPGTGTQVHTAVPVLTTRTNTSFRLEGGTGPINKWGGTISSFCITDVSGACEAVPDTIPPVITLVGSTVNLTVGDTYTDPGYSATDNIDGTITGSVAVTGWDYSTAVAGTHTLHYNVSDAAGNAATEKTRTVIVSAAVGGGSSVPGFSIASTTSLAGGAFLDAGRILALIAGIILGAIIALFAVGFFSRKVKQHVTGSKF